MTLSEGTVGHHYSVIKLTLDKKLKRRLEALGLTEHTKIELLNKKNNGTSIIKARGTRLAIGKDVASNIEVKKEVLYEGRY